MKLMFLGADHEVTGSCHYIEACGKSILLDCGMEQGLDTRRHPMRLLGQSGIWELFIPGLAAMDQYKFHVVQSTGKQVDKCDPYAFYAQLRPETASVIYPIGRYKWKDRKWMTERKQMSIRRP